MEKVNIYINERFYGSIKMAFLGLPFTTKEKEIHEEIVRRLPFLKEKKYTIDYDKA